jgi:hypothetical protein
MQRHTNLRETLRETVTLLRDEDLDAVRVVVGALLAAPPQVRDLVRQRLLAMVVRSLQ